MRKKISKTSILITDFFLFLKMCRLFYPVLYILKYIFPLKIFLFSVFLHIGFRSNSNTSKYRHTKKYCRGKGMHILFDQNTNTSYTITIYLLYISTSLFWITHPPSWVPYPKENIPI